MKLNELEWNEDNNVKVVLLNNTDISFGLDDIEAFVKWLDNKSSGDFFHIHIKNKRNISINRNNIVCIYYK